MVSLADASGAATRLIESNIKSNVTSPDVLNGIFGRLAQSNSLPDWVKALNIQFKAFTSSNSTETGLGFSYDFTKSLQSVPLSKTNINPVMISLDVFAKGNVAFEERLNPNDFLESGASLHLWHSTGAKYDYVPQVDDFAVAEYLRDKHYQTMSELEADPKWIAFAKDFDRQYPHQFFWDFNFHGKLESNQSFSRKQGVYGGSVDLAFRSWDPDSPWTRLNLFDWPFALTRMLGGEGWSPNGRFIPSLTAGVDLVDPYDDKDRLAIDSDSSPYPRFNFEVSLKSRVLTIDNKDIWISATYKIFQEIGPSSAIRMANFDTQQFIAVELSLPWNFAITYSNGKLPLDRKSDSSIALGYKLNF